MHCDMRPGLLDMTKDESIQCLRHLELDAYSRLVSALRAQGSLSPSKEKLLKETGSALNISPKRQVAEVRRALTDEKLNTIAYYMCDQNEYADEWNQGQKRLSITPRLSPETVFSNIAEEVTENSDQNFKQPTSSADRKRFTNLQNNQTVPIENNKTNLFRVPETPKHEENRKRKISDSSSNLAQYILGPSKISKIQQIYRQKTKLKMKEQQLAKAKAEQERQEKLQKKIQQSLIYQKSAQTIKIPSSTSITPVSSNGSKMNMFANNQPLPGEYTEQVQETRKKYSEQNHSTSQPSVISDSLKNRLKIIPRSSNNNLFKPVSTTDPQKTFKNAITKTIPATGQKLIVVSNSQSIPTNSILQRTLSLPIVKNGDKFKIVSTSATPTNNSIANCAKHKIVTVKTNNQVNLSNKVFPLTQLQMLNKANIKVLPIGGKIISKTSTSSSSSVYLMNNIGNLQPLKSVDNYPFVSTSKFDSTAISEVADSTYNKNMENSMKNPQIVFRKSDLIAATEDYDAKIDEFHIQSIPDITENSMLNEIESEEIIEDVEIDQSGMLCLPEIGNYISEHFMIDCMDTESEISKAPREIINLNHLSRIASEITIENVLTGTQLVHSENKQN